MKIAVIHGERRLRQEIDNFCTDCSKRRSVYNFCEIKNQRACKKVQEAFKGRIHGDQKDEYVRHTQYREVKEPFNRFCEIDFVD
jgi:hypothetical protein